jgi:hypothetical protein
MKSLSIHTFCFWFVFLSFSIFLFLVVSFSFTIVSFAIIAFTFGFVSLSFSFEVAFVFDDGEALFAVFIKAVEDIEAGEHLPDLVFIFAVFGDWVLCEVEVLDVFQSLLYPQDQQLFVGGNII